MVGLAAAGLALALSGKSSPPSATNRLGPLQRQETGNSNLAASWVVQQVSTGSVVSCDKQMCAVLEAHGFPKADVLVLTPNDPHYPLSSTLVIETPTVRTLFGTSLATEYAPTVLTTIGKGAAAIEIRVIAPNGAVAYQRALATDQANRQSFGAELLKYGPITTSPQARAEMAAGDVDARVLIALEELANDVASVSIVDFGNVATAESADVPYRYVDVALNVKASGLSGSAYLDALRKALLSAPYRPLRTATVTVKGYGEVLRILFGAPTPLTLLIPGG